jgi:transcriptional regulator with XRE-family HTH domain
MALNNLDLKSVDLNGLLSHISTHRRYLRTHKGWLHLARSYRRLSAGQVARRMGVSRQLPLQLEKSERKGTITLNSLRSVANALDHDLIYLLLPKDMTPASAPEKNAVKPVAVAKPAPVDKEGMLNLLRKLM